MSTGRTSSAFGSSSIRVRATESGRRGALTARDDSRAIRDWHGEAITFSAESPFTSKRGADQP